MARRAVFSPGTSGSFFLAPATRFPGPSSRAFAPPLSPLRTWEAHSCWSARKVAVWSHAHGAEPARNAGRDRPRGDAAARWRCPAIRHRRRSCRSREKVAVRSHTCGPPIGSPRARGGPLRARRDAGGSAVGAQGLGGKNFGILRGPVLWPARRATPVVTVRSRSLVARRAGRSPTGVRLSCDWTEPKV